MRWLLSGIVWLILAPFRIIKFILSDILLFGIIGGVLSLIRSFIRIITKILLNPITLLILAGAAAAFVISGEERKNKVKAIVGL
ncbi:MAG TPA: hypothetical protein ENN34_06480 [Deltaproteobacteria bacterium]|nr:hypothetical protein [Deltaproteobacteria bacterium]